MMRILYIRNLNQVAKTYGVELARRGHSVRVYEPDLAGNDAVLPIKLLKMPGRILSLRDIVTYLNHNSFDIVHIHWATYGVLGHLSRVPFIVECHGSDVRYHLNQPFYRLILKSVFNRAAAVLCITPDLLPIVRSIRSDALFLPGPVDTERFSLRENLRTSPPRPWTILVFMRLDPIKGPEIATEGILRFTRRHAGVRVHVVDWGPEKEKYKQLYGDRFEFICPVAPELVQNLIVSADVVVGQFKLGMLSFCELQAMSCAKPVVCSFRYDEAYSSPPPLYQAATPEEVDEKLEYLYQHPIQGIELGQRAREWVIANHSHRMLATRLEQIYQTVLVK
jgi:glycosyltransferase involved in cell wall biosynthesis